MSAAYRCRVTGYAGFEAQILSLRNANREQAQTRPYLDWRYRTPQAGSAEPAPDPQIFWMLNARDEPVGMASYIFRPYWIAGRFTHVAVLGDISLDASLRGAGLGRQLLAFATDHMATHFPDSPSFVIPTEAARRTLQSVGWDSAGSLVQLVFVANPEQALRRKLGSSVVAAGIAAMLRTLEATVLQLRLKGSCKIQIVTQLDDSFNELWTGLPRRELLIRDMSTVSLGWRYLQHPNRNYRIARFGNGNELIGYVIFERDGDTCNVSDVLVARQPDLTGIMALFCLHCLADPGIATVRMSMEAAHPYRRSFPGACFITRPPTHAFQWKSAAGTPGGRNGLSWCVTGGDKDV